MPMRFVLALVLVSSLASCGRDDRRGGTPGPGTGGISSCSEGCSRIESVCMLSDPECTSTCSAGSSAMQSTFFGCAGMADCSAILGCLCEADPECMEGCGCDVDFDCSAGCACDPECGGGGTDAGPGTGETGEDGDACTCDSDPAAGDGVGRRCAGTDDGCVGFGLSGELNCLAEARSGAGVCRYPCTETADCPSGYSCVDSALVDTTGTYWKICVR